MPDLLQGKIYIRDHFLHSNIWSDVDVVEEDWEIS